MVLYTCNKCGKTYDHKGGYIKHLNRKLPCDKKNIVSDKKIANIVANDNIDVNMTEGINMTKKVLYTYNKCGKTYDHKGGYIEHLNRKLPCDKKIANIVTDANVAHIINDNIDVNMDDGDNMDVNMNDNMDVNMNEGIDMTDTMKIINLIQKLSRQMNVKFDLISKKIQHLESQNVTNVYINDKLKVTPLT
jgi:uncharacterized C2H2 Zn-finger protein